MTLFRRMACAVAALLCLTAWSVQAGDIAALAEELLTVMQQPECHAHGCSNFIAGLCHDLDQSKPKGWQSSVSTQDIFRAASEMNWNGVKGAYVALYANAFTPAELQKAIEFYRTPSGQRCLVLPYRTGRASQLNQSVVKAFQQSDTGQSFIKKHDAVRRQAMAIDQEALNRVNLRLKELFRDKTN